MMAFINGALTVILDSFPFKSSIFGKYEKKKEREKVENEEKKDKKEREWRDQMVLEKASKKLLYGR